MKYLALLAEPESGPASVPGTPEFEESVAHHAVFDAYAGPAIVGGGALYPVAEAATVRNTGGTPLVTDGPFAESNEVVGGFYIFEAHDFDAALDLVRRIPDMDNGYTELWPMVEWFSTPHTAGCWLALLREPSGGADDPGTKAWDEGAAAHARFTEAAGSAVRAGGALRPPASATTVRTKGGEVMLTDGPFSESTEIVNGLYVLSAPDRATAVRLALQIPMGPGGCIELRRMVDE